MRPCPNPACPEPTNVKMSYYRVYRVICEGCGMEGPMALDKDTKAEAANLWDALSAAKWQMDNVRIAELEQRALTDEQINEIKYVLSGAASDVPTEKAWHKIWDGRNGGEHFPSASFEMTWLLRGILACVDAEEQQKNSTTGD